MGAPVLWLTALVALSMLYPSDAARGGGGRFSSSRFSSSRVSVRFSSYRSSFRSYRSNSRYYRSGYYRYGYGYGYGYGYSYGTNYKAISAVGMGGLTTNKQALLIAGSVYVAYSLRPKMYTSSGIVISHSIDNYAMCSGFINYDPVFKNGSYAILDNGTDTAAFGNATLGSFNTSGGGFNGSVRTFRYFMCPSDLISGVYESDDTYCCGPPGYQMCCDKEDFEEQLEDTSLRLRVGLTLAILVSLGIAGLIIHFARKRCRRRSAAARTPAVIFHPVATSDPAGDLGAVKFEAAPIGQTPPTGNLAYPTYPPQAPGTQQPFLPQQMTGNLAYPAYPPQQMPGDPAYSAYPAPSALQQPFLLQQQMPGDLAYSLYPPQATSDSAGFTNGTPGQPPPPYPG